MNTLWRVSLRSFSSLSPRQAAPTFASGPAPPQLPEKDQKLFEELQRSSTGAFSTPKSSAVADQPLESSSKPRINQSSLASSTGRSSENDESLTITARIEAKGDGEELHPDIRRGARPEFEGERNPKTGEVGGPKNDPLRWGGEVDWSYNGRVTDF